MKLAKLLVFAWMVVLQPLAGHAQEEESAEVYLEEYTDEFQESFFEALKQKGIENYDKAINALLRCKEIDPQSHVVDHELAKTYQLNKQLALAQDYALEALRQQPENPWYLKTYMGMINLNSLDLDVLSGQIPFEVTRLKENLVLFLVEKEQYGSARQLVKKWGDNPFTRKISQRIADSLERKDNKPDTSPVAVEEAQTDPLLSIKRELQDHLDKGNFGALNKGSTEALEAYPLQAFFYYTKGVALNRISDFEGAEEYLIMALDFANEDVELINNIYRELALMYQGLGDPEKANMYLSKIKNGS